MSNFAVAKSAKKMQKRFAEIVVFTLCLLLVFSCNGTKFVGDDELLLTHNTITSTDPDVEVKTLRVYLHQQPNTKWFSLLKVPLGIYSMSGADTTKAVNRLLRKWGEAPVTLDSAKIQTSCKSLQTAMQNRGYLDVQVSADKDIKNKRVKIHYNVTPGGLYSVRNVSFNVADKRIDSLLEASGKKALSIGQGSAFSVNALQDTRKSITSWLNDNGYMYFNKDNITFLVDSCREERFVDITMNIGLYRRNSTDSLSSHPYYTIRNVAYVAPANQKMKLRNRVLDINTLIRSGEQYSAQNVQKTYSRFSRLQTVRSTNIYFREVKDTLDGDSLSPSTAKMPNLVDAEVHITRKKPHIIRLQPEGTNTSGDFGAALSATYENRNVFHGGEVFSLQARVAFEAIKGLEGYQNSNYEEYGVEGRLTFPEFLIPGVSRDFLRRHNATSELFASYNLQNRPEFHRRVFTAGWRYRWSDSSGGRIGYQLDAIGVDYVSMPWISDTFKKDYLDSHDTRNAILRYNYENLLIMKTGMGITYTDASNSLKFNVETAGNLLYGISNLFNTQKDDEGRYKFALVAFAQYVKVDADYTHLLKLDDRNSLALHARVGIGVPYGNSKMLPFEKRYFSGGANSVRGWSVRELGPGRFRGVDGRIDFINQTGDFRLDLNAELRTNLFWKFQGAIFVDAGNIWTLRQYNDQPGGLFTLKSLYDEIAVAYGIGLRLNFDYFILRLDLGMKAITPNYADTSMSNDGTSYTYKDRFPIIRPNFKRDYALHFAVGLPF